MKALLNATVLRTICVAFAMASAACATTNTAGTADPGDRPVGTTGTVSGPESVPATSDPGEVPVGQELDVRLQTQLSSETAKVEDRFQATTVADLLQGNRTLIPAGSVVRGVVQAVDPATRLDRQGSLTLSFDRIVVGGRERPIRAMATRVFESEGIKGETTRIGAGAGLGAIVGGILGGLEGAIAGIAIGAGGTIAATEGKDVVLPAGTIVRIRFDSPLQIGS
jgi:hypothetical protein